MDEKNNYSTRENSYFEIIDSFQNPNQIERTDQLDLAITDITKKYQSKTYKKLE